MCTCVHEGPRHIRSPGASIIGVVSHPMWVTGIESLKEQYLLLTEPSLNPKFVTF